MTSEFTPDCARCAALCCVALAFDRGPRFAFDKPAGLPCRNLAGHACRIHGQLPARGFAGCAAYDCQGAGQAVTAAFGRSWRDDPALLAPMAAAFAAMRTVQDLRAQLEAARSLALAPQDEPLRERLMRALDPPGGWTRAAIEALDLAALRAGFRQLAAALRRALSGQPA